MRHESHRNIAKLFYPKIPFKTIDSVNSILDAPSRKAKAFNQTYNTLMLPDGKGGIKEQYFNPFDLFNLGKSTPHRRTNHDIVSAAVSAGMEHGPEGIMLALLHLNLDNISDQWKNMMGRSMRDLQESMLNVAIEKMIDRRRVRSSY